MMKPLRASMETKAMKIKKCPHCGGDAYIVRRHDYRKGIYFVFCQCDICGACGKTFAGDMDPALENWSTNECVSAVNAWNMRFKEEGGGED